MPKIRIGLIQLKGHRFYGIKNARLTDDQAMWFGLVVRYMARLNEASK